MTICGWCDEEVLAHERQAFCETPMHWECAVRSIIGSVAHIERRCGCYVPGSDAGDDPRLTRREAACRAAMAFGREGRCHSPNLN
jgi:hypothetical protein